MKTLRVKLDIHQRVALWWVLGAPFVFGPVLVASPVPDVGRMLACGVALVTASIAACPLLLRWPLFRRLFCWTDALSAEQRAALSARNMSEYYRLAAVGDYFEQVLPYIKRLIALVIVLSLVSAFAPMGWFSVFSVWYPMGVLILSMASLPWPTLIHKR
ncbi:hypothetical protein A9R05_42625 (plasmid) [Burkholderia sp. KK1]|uniref:hypothetical protein n=1 Tax=Burkholderia TaxID=32008 RepID=UPI0009798F9B|nr:MULTISPECIES: hypothetical protein [Burkholderia]AQH05716.1 hypothetical protein A9R05_42625 [Burkholderia sp. KK1]